MLSGIGQTCHTGAAVLRVRLLQLLAALLLSIAVADAQDDPLLPPDTTEAAISDTTISDQPSDSVSADSLHQVDSAAHTVDSARFAIDSLIAAGAIDTTTAKKMLPPPMRLLDTLTEHFVRKWKYYDVKRSDHFPRNAGGFISQEASYLSQTYLETPVRTTIAPFGLTGGNLVVQSGEHELRPFGRFVPPDGRIDYGDLGTSFVGSYGLLEGPLSGISSLDGGLGMLVLKPITIPPDEARSELFVETGWYGFAYTRAKLARQFSPKFGLAISTDYRLGDGPNLNAEEEDYYIAGHLFSRLRPTTWLEGYIDIHGREGEVPIMPDSNGALYERDRKDIAYNLLVTEQGPLGGDITAKLHYQTSRSGYDSQGSTYGRTIKPERYFLELSYLRHDSTGTLQMAALVGADEYQYNLDFMRRRYGTATISAMTRINDGYGFAFARYRAGENEKPVIEGAFGWAGDLGPQWYGIISTGYLTRWPDITDRFLARREDPTINGGYADYGNPSLESEKRFTGNIALIRYLKNLELSGSLNLGIVDKAIYYDRIYDDLPGGEVFPDNDNIRFADFNLRADFDSLWIFYGTISSTIRRVDSDRWGPRPPYSPRWYIDSQIGFRYYIERFQISTRFWGNIRYGETMLSHRLEELTNAPLVTGGITASLKTFTFFFISHNMLRQIPDTMEGYSLTDWYISWGFNWKFRD